jgi:tRNA pseudouridine32 synthase/23S rRNA pseudouridine746 synthase
LAVRFESHVLGDDTQREIVSVLEEETGLSRRRIKDAMQKGAVWVTGIRGTQRVRRWRKTLEDAETVHFYFDEDVLSEVPPEAELISDEGGYSVWNKPFGMRSQGSKWADHCTITRWAEQHLHPYRPAFLVHRLDRAASGLILVAHEKRVSTRLSKLFEARSVEKRYSAVVHGRVSGSEKPILVDEAIDGREARSRYHRVTYDEDTDRTELEVVIETGRKHQIRRHMAGIGHPVVGDRMYGREGDREDLCLVSEYLAFECPVGGNRKEFRIGSVEKRRG